MVDEFNLNLTIMSWDIYGPRIERVKMSLKLENHFFLIYIVTNDVNEKKLFTNFNDMVTLSIRGP